MYPGDILESSINPHASIERFKRATTKEEEEGVQRQRGLYRQYLKLNSGGDYVIGDRDDDGLKESVNSKLRRLMHEVKELGEQVQEVSFPFSPSGWVDLGRFRRTRMMGWRMKLWKTEYYWAKSNR